MELQLKGSPAQVCASHTA